MEILEWDSDFFGKKIARLDAEKDIDPSLVLDELVRENVDFAQILCSIKAQHQIESLETIGFHLLDIKVDLDYSFPPSYQFQVPRHIRLAGLEDKKLLTQISDHLFLESRFYKNEEIFKVDKVDEMFNEWLSKSISGKKDDYCLIYENHDKVLGFATVKEDKAKQVSSIGLFGISPLHQGKGVGGAFLEEILSFLGEKQIKKIHISTQGKNIKAINTYVKKGFKITDISLWYHWTNPSNL